MAAAAAAQDRCAYTTIRVSTKAGPAGFYNVAVTPARRVTSSSSSSSATIPYARAVKPYTVYRTSSSSRTYLVESQIDGRWTVQLIRRPGRRNISLRCAGPVTTSYNIINARTAHVRVTLPYIDVRAGRALIARKKTPCPRPLKILLLSTAGFGIIKCIEYRIQFFEHSHTVL